MNKTKDKNAHVGSMSVTDHQKFTCDCQSSDHVNNSIKKGQWPDPEPLANDPSTPTPYPINSFTGLLKRVIELVAYYAQVPLAMAGQCVLGALSHIGQCFVNTPLGHNMPASLILITESESGSGKTQAMKLTHYKINEYEHRKYEQYLKDINVWQSNKTELKGKELADYKESNPMPSNPKTMFKEATIEPILDMFISGQISDASWTTDEAGQFFNGHTMTGDTVGSALSSITTLYSDGAVSRVRSQKSAYASPYTDAHNARLTLLLQGQRVVLEPALTNRLMIEQGFLARALLACPEDLRGKRVWNDAKRRHDNPYNNPHLIKYWQRFQSLLHTLSTYESKNAKDKPERLKMQWANVDTEQMFYSYMQAIENRQAIGGDLQYFKAHASRMAENASRIASLIAFFEERQTITIDDIKRAFMIVEYSIKESLRYLDATPKGEQNDSEKLSSWLVKKACDKTPAILNRTDAYNGAPKPMRKNNKVLQNELDNLESKGHIRQSIDGKKKIIEINPKLYK